MDVKKANQEALSILLKAQPVLVDMGIARDVVPGMKDRTIFHSGPPITWERMSGPTRGGVIGAALYEGWAKTREEAEELAAGGGITFDSNHHHGCAQPMGGILSPGMPVFIVENRAFGNRAFVNINEGPGRVLRMGAFDESVIANLKWLEKTAYPCLRAGIDRIRGKSGGMNLKNLMAQALHMGDELHTRTKAGNYLFVGEIVPFLLEADRDFKDLARVVSFINDCTLFFINLTMAAAKASLDPTLGVEGSSMVSIMSRNGTDFGIKVAGLPDLWFTAPAARPKALLFPGYRDEDVNPDIGDSAIMETMGLGANATAASPAVVLFTGGVPSEAVKTTLEMFEICLGENDVYTIPALDFRGTPTGIDILRVVEKGITPVVNTGVTHREPGIGQVGGGVARMPVEPFKNALSAFGDKYL